jgi:hypothetical protein
MCDLPWQPGGARGGDKSAMRDGAQYLMVVRLASRLCGSGEWTDWHVCEVGNDEDGFRLESNGWIWRWEDIDWVLPLSCLKLPASLRSETVRGGETPKCER